MQPNTQDQVVADAALVRQARQAFGGDTVQGVLQGAFTNARAATVLAPLLSSADLSHGTGSGRGQTAGRGASRGGGARIGKGGGVGGKNRVKGKFLDGDESDPDYEPGK